MNNDRHILPRSHHEPHPDHPVLGPVHPEERIEVTVVLRPCKPLPIAGMARLDHEEFWGRHGIDVNDAIKIDVFSDDNQIVMDDFVGRNSALTLHGCAVNFEEAFGVTLVHAAHPDGGTYRTHREPISVPAELKDIITGVFGMDDRPVAKPHYRRRKECSGYNANPQIVIRGDKTAVSNATVDPPAGAFTPPRLATLYGFPEANGEGQCIAILELGGGFDQKDLESYFKQLGIPTPNVTSVSVGHAKNRPTGQPDGPDGEVMLDIEVAAAIAPKAKIVVCFAPNTDQGFLDGITAVIHDRVHKPSVLSISWGGPESSWTGSAMSAMDQAFQAAAALGVTVCVASGDNGSDDGVGDGANHVDFPASSPHVLACGGTSLKASGDHIIVSEVVWNDGDDGGATGGGFSAEFARPSYQDGSTRGRGVPDVCADADPATGYYVRVDGHDTVVGGTSAVAPLWAALVARCNQLNGKNAGFVNPLLYAAPGAFNDIHVGNNGAFSAGTGWDACTGLGSPRGNAIVVAMKG